MKLTKQQKLIEKSIESCYYRRGNGVQIDIMDISKIYEECRETAKNGISADLELKMIEVIAKYRKN